MIANPYLRSSVMSAHGYTVDDDSERPMDYELSLLPKVVPCMLNQLVHWRKVMLTSVNCLLLVHMRVHVNMEKSCT